MNSTTDNTNSTKRLKLWPILKWLLFAAVLWFVGQRGYRLWASTSVESVRIEYVWLIGAVIAYVVGWLPSVWFWQRLLKLHGYDVGFAAAARAYYCGHLGKYIPGKATVLVIRAGLLKASGVSPAAAAITATYETLGSMGVGVAIAAALLPVLLPTTGDLSVPKWILEARSTPWIVPTILAVGGAVLLPVIAKLSTKVAQKLTPDSMLSDAEAASTPITSRFLLLGAIALSIGWCFHGISLGCVIRSIIPDGLSADRFPFWLAAVSLSTAVGFLMIFAPGGLGVREGLLMEALRLQPEFTDQQGVEIAVILRCVWFATEVLAAIVLYYVSHQSHPPNDANLKEP